MTTTSERPRGSYKELFGTLSGNGSIRSNPAPLPTGSTVAPWLPARRNITERRYKDSANGRFWRASLKQTHFLGRIAPDRKGPSLKTPKCPGPRRRVTWLSGILPLLFGLAGGSGGDELLLASAGNQSQNCQVPPEEPLALQCPPVPGPLPLAPSI